MFWAAKLARNFGRLKKSNCSMGRICGRSESTTLVYVSIGIQRTQRIFLFDFSEHLNVIKSKR